MFAKLYTKMSFFSRFMFFFLFLAIPENFVENTEVLVLVTKIKLGYIYNHYCGNYSLLVVRFHNLHQCCKYDEFDILRRQSIKYHETIHTVHKALLVAWSKFLNAILLHIFCSRHALKENISVDYGI